MTNDEAIQWVDANKGRIVRPAQRFIRYAPYDIDDYVQLAYASAVEAAIVVRRQPGLLFTNIFRAIFNQHVSEITPISEEALSVVEERKRAAAANKGVEKKKPGNRSGGACKSFSINQRVDFDLTIIGEETIEEEAMRVVDIEKVYWEKVAGILTPTENKVMEMALGLTMQGVMSEREIAAHMGVSRRAVRTLEQRAINKAAAAVIDISKARLNRDRLNSGSTTTKQRGSDKKEVGPEVWQYRRRVGLPRV